MMNVILSGVSKINDEDLHPITEKWDFYKPNRNFFITLLVIGLFIGIVVALLIGKIFSSKRKM